MPTLPWLQLPEREVLLANKVDFTIKYKRKDGTLLYGLTSIHRRRDPEGETVGYEGIIHDITRLKQVENELVKARDDLEQRVIERTAQLQESNLLLKQEIRERRRVEETLKQSEALYRMAAEMTNNYVFSLQLRKDGTAEVEWIKGAYSSIHGDRESVSIPGGWLNIVVPDDIPKAKEMIRQYRDNKEVEGELRVFAKDGGVRWIRHAGRPIWDDKEGRVVRIIGASCDITDFKYTSEDLDKEKTTLDYIFDLTPNSICLCDAEGRLLKYNQAFLERFKDHWGPDNTLFTSPLLAAEDYAEEILKLNDGEIVKIRELVYEPQESASEQDSEAKYFHFTGFPVRNNEGNIENLVVILEDFSDRKTIEKELQLSCEQLQRQTSELLAANEEMEAFSYTVSHDLRAPLWRINGFAEMLMSNHSDKLDKAGKEIIERLCLSSAHTSQLVDNLLQLLSVTRGKIKREQVNLSTMAKEISNNLKSENPDRKVNFIIAEKASAEGDQGLLWIVLENILGNAWKFTSKKRKAKIEFGISVEESGRTVYFVKDNGAGFDEAKADLLFTPFKRLHKESDFGGTGIGLATVQKIISRHGGSVWAKGKVGKGATFMFTLE